VVYVKHAYPVSKRTRLDTWLGPVLPTPAEASLTGDDGHVHQIEGIVPEDEAEEGAHSDTDEVEAALSGVAIDDVMVQPQGQEVIVQQAVCGGADPPELSEYEKLRARNIRERDEAMKEALEEIDELKQEMRENAPGAKKKREAEEEVGESSKRRKVETLVAARRSGRERKLVTYSMEEMEGRNRNRGRKNSRVSSGSPARKPKKVSSKLLLPHPPPSNHKLRPRKSINYSEQEADRFFWCSMCGKEEYKSCHKHLTITGEVSNLKVEPSGLLGQKVGDGVINKGRLIPEGVLFGPYTGKFIPYKVYKKAENANKESGYAWELRDECSGKTVGYIDPGVNPDPQNHWMAKVNCPNKTEDQNLIGFQLGRQIYYRVIKDIPHGTELLVWYGDGFAKALGINLETVNMYRGKEDHTTEAISCDFCETALAGEKELEDHLGMGGNKVYRCGVKQNLVMVWGAEDGKRKYICKVCGKGFKQKCGLVEHVNVHSKEKTFKCEVEGCGESFLWRTSLLHHKGKVHDGVKYACPLCGKSFNSKQNMTAHIKHVHQKVKPNKCPKCGVLFECQGSLTRHIKDVHDKVRAFNCELCNKSFKRGPARKLHIESQHENIRYPCTWPDCTHQAPDKNSLKIHLRRHNKDWIFECQLCEDQLNIRWGCMKRSVMKQHKMKKHPVEWEEEQEAYRKDHHYICKYKRCLKRFKTEVEKVRHEAKLHRDMCIG
jgi:hypothetical protein